VLLKCWADNPDERIVFTSLLAFLKDYSEETSTFPLSEETKTFPRSEEATNFPQEKNGSEFSLPINANTTVAF
jgi:hypothetical protein